MLSGTGFQVMAQDRRVRAYAIFESEALLNPAADAPVPSGFEVIDDLDLAMRLENQPDVPAGYLVWLRELERAQAHYVSRPDARPVEAEIDARTATLNAYWDKIEPTPLAETGFGQFWETAGFDIAERLKMVSVAAGVLGDRMPDFLENLRLGLKLGYYPCGLRADGTMILFDPRALDGYAACKVAAFAQR